MTHEQRFLASCKNFFFTSIRIASYALGVIFAERPLLGRVAGVLNFLHLCNGRQMNTQDFRNTFVAF